MAVVSESDPGAGSADPGRCTAHEIGQVGGMRIRDHDKADLALAALTLTVAAAAACSEATRWATGRVRRHRSARASRPALEQQPRS